VSIAAVALEHRLNANLLRRWVTEEERIREAGLIAAGSGSQVPSIAANTAFVPVELPRPSVATAQEIVIELRRKRPGNASCPRALNQVGLIDGANDGAANR
jgi:transposase-like protein